MRTSHQSQRAGGRPVGGTDGLDGEEASPGRHHISTDDGACLSTNAAPANAGRSKAHRQVLAPVLAMKARKRAECCILAGQQQFAFPGMAGGRLLRRAGGWFPPLEAGRGGGQPTRAGGRAPARLALRPSKDELRSSNDKTEGLRVPPIRGLGRWKDTMHKGARRHGRLSRGSPSF
jgi:hypothetical protein